MSINYYVFYGGGVPKLSYKLGTVLSILLWMVKEYVIFLVCV